MGKYAKKLIFLVGLTSLLPFYQNCGEQFSSSQSNPIGAIIESSPVGGSSTDNSNAPIAEFDEPTQENQTIQNISLNDDSIVVSQMNPNTAIISWQTNELATAVLYLGTDPANLSIQFNDESQSKTKHEVQLKELTPSSTYFFKVSGQTMSGFSYSSNQLSFTTKDTPVQPNKVTTLDDSSISITLISYNEVKVEWSTPVYTKAHIKHSTDKDNIVKTQQIENSFDYKNHIQFIKGLDASSTYYIKIYSEAENGDIYQSNVLSFETVKKPEPQSNFVPFSQFRKNNNDTVQEGNWDNIHGSSPPKAGISSWQRVTIKPYATSASGRKLLLDSSIKEAWASYKIQLGSNWTPSDNVKLPGFSSHINDGWQGVAGGNGGGWGGRCRSWSARSGIVRPVQGQSYSGKMSMYVYHKDSKNYSGNAKASDHPCLNPSNNPVQSNKRGYGQTFNSKGFIRDQKWHTVTHHIRLNEISKSNGLVELYLDGTLVARAENMSFTDNNKYHNIAFWFQVYHGGSADTTGTAHDIFFHNFNWNAGPVDLTQK